MSATAGRVCKMLMKIFRGLPMQRKRAQQDAMSVGAKRGEPHLFITMTCNNRWRGLTQNLLPNQTAFDRRIFVFVP